MTCPGSPLPQCSRPCRLQAGAAVGPARCPGNTGEDWQWPERHQLALIGDPAVEPLHEQRCDRAQREAGYDGECHDQPRRRADRGAGDVGALSDRQGRIATLAHRAQPLLVLVEVGGVESTDGRVDGDPDILVAQRNGLSCVLARDPRGELRPGGDGDHGDDVALAQRLDLHAAFDVAEGEAHAHGTGGRRGRPRRLDERGRCLHRACRIAGVAQ